MNDFSAIAAALKALRAQQAKNDRTKARLHAGFKSAVVSFARDADLLLQRFGRDAAKKIVMTRVETVGLKGE